MTKPGNRNKRIKYENYRSRKGKPRGPGVAGNKSGAKANLNRRGA